MSRRSRSAVTLALAVGCGAAPFRYAPEQDGVTPSTRDGLYRVRSSEVDGIFVRPLVRFSEYDAVIVDPVRVTYQSPPRPVTHYQRDRGNYVLDPTQMERLKGVFHEVFTNELARSPDFAIASEPGPRVLRLSAQLVDFVWEAPPVRANETDLISRTGVATLLLDVRDSRTGAALGRVVDRTALRPLGSGAGFSRVRGTYENGPVNNWGAVSDACWLWARALRGALETWVALPDIPMPPAPAGD